MSDDVIDIIQCGWCLEALPRTVRMIKRGTKFHKGSCANAARAILWPEKRIKAHMKMMRDAATRARAQKLRDHLSRLAKGLLMEVALVRCWNAGYKAGWAARKRS